MKFKNRSWTGIKYYHWGFKNGWGHFWLSQWWRGAVGIFCAEVKEAKGSVICVITQQNIFLQECQKHSSWEKLDDTVYKKEAVINEVGKVSSSIILDMKCHGNKCVLIGRQWEVFASFGIEEWYGQSLKVKRMNIMIQQNEFVIP